MSLRFRSLFGLGLAALGMICVSGYQGWAAAPRTRKKPPAAPMAAKQQVVRGKYLVAVLGCGDCHSPRDQRGRVIPGRELSGHPEGAPLPEWDPSLMQRNILSTIGPTLTAFAGPYGVSVAGNLTPDKETGIGKLNADALVKSWKTGKHWKKTDRLVLPPMPIEAYRLLTEEDIRAIFAYLMTRKPIKNRSPDSVIAPPPPPGSGKAE